MRYFTWIYTKASLRLVLIVLGVFIVFLGGVLPVVSYLSETVFGLEGSPDTEFRFDIGSYYAMRSQYGVAGRRIYIILRWTFDVVWPIVYTAFFMITTAYFAKKIIRGRGIFLLIVPLAALVFDFLENSIATLFMIIYPSQVDSLVYALMTVSLIKWVMVGASFMIVIGLSLINLIKTYALPR
jgi:hypothetical protein